MAETPLNFEKIEKQARWLFKHFHKPGEPKISAYRRISKHLDGFSPYTLKNIGEHGQRPGTELAGKISKLHDRLRDPRPPSGRTVRLAGDPAELDLIIQALTPKERTSILLFSIGEYWDKKVVTK